MLTYNIVYYVCMQQNCLESLFAIEKLIEKWQYLTSHLQEATFYEQATYKCERASLFCPNAWY